MPRHPWRRLALVATTASAVAIPIALGGAAAEPESPSPVHLPHSSFAQAHVGRPVSRNRVRPGDLVFFSTAGPGASHVGVAIGESTVVSATSTGVQSHSISDAYWGAHYVGARRVITN